MAQAFVWGQGGAQLTPEQVAQQRAIAAALMKEGSSYAPVGSWLEGLGRVANAAAGAFKEYRANQAEKAGQEAWQQRFASIAPSLGGSAYGGSLDMSAPSASQDKMRSDAGITGTQANAGEAFASVAPRLIGDLSKDFGLTPEQAAGVVGQLGHESAGFGTLQEVSPMVPGSRGGYGYAQWTGLRRKAFEEYAAANGLDPSSYEANYGFLANELRNTPEGAVLQDVAAAPDAMTAGRVFTDKFLRPGIPGYDSRDKWTERALAYADPSSMGGQVTGSNPQAEVAAALMGTNPDLMPPPAAAMAPTQAGQHPMPQPRQPVNTAGMNYDPATGMIGPAAGLNAGATLAPAATEAFYGGQSPVQKTDTPILRQIAGLLGGGQGGQQPAAPNGQRAVAQALAGQPMSAQSAASPQGMPSIGQLMELAADPYAPEGAKAVVNALIQQQLQQQDPAYRMGLEKSQLELEQLRNPTLKPIEVGGVLLDPKTYQPIYDSRQNENRPTDDMREYEAAKAQGFTGTLQDWILSQKKAGAASTTVNMGEGDKFYENLDKKNAETFAALSDAGMQARAKLAKVGRLQELLATSPQGPIAALKQAAGEWGINTEGLSDIQAASSIIESLVPQQRTPGSGPMSDADIAMYRASLPRLINQPGGNEIIINTLAGIAQYEAQMGEIADMVADRAITPAEGRKRIRELKNPLEGFKAPAGGNQPSPMPTGNSRSTLGLDRKPPVVINGYTIEEAN